VRREVFIDADEGMGQTLITRIPAGTGDFMKLIYFSICAVLVGAIWVVFFGYVEFFVILLISILPLNLMYGSRSLKDIHQDKDTYRGWRLMIYPPVIYGVLMLTHSFWLNEFAKLFA
jgi:membrane protein implicated in regulation of membrane protease activity